MKKYTVLVVICLMLCHCSVYMAAKQPDAKNLDVMTVGTPRAIVLGELGPPITTEVKDGQRSDIFNFTQGYSKGAKTSRAIFHGLADIFTCGLWEVAGTPAEAVFDGTKVTYQIEYDSSDKVKRVTPLTQKSKDEINPQPVAPSSVVPIQ
jgi:outer membrane protein assembly factor BamE (lipoprotein component of BamABCDE complex)